MQSNVNIKNANNYHFYGDSNYCKLGLDINADILKLINISNANDVQLFIVEFNRLSKYVNESDLDMLNKQIFFDSIANTNITAATVNEISFGVLDDTIHQKKFMNFLDALQSVGFQCLNTIQSSISNVSRNNNVIFQLRYDCVNRNTKVHLIKFMKRHDFYWFIELTNAGLVYTGSYSEDSNETEFVSTFDAFELNKCYINDIRWYLPEDIRYFLAQTKTSRFVSCDLNTTKEFRSKYRYTVNVNNVLKYKFIKLLKTFKQLMKNELKQFWIIGGTLLGWLRQCSLFTHTTDVDFVTWSQYASEQFTERFMINSSNENHLHLKSIYGFIDEAYEMSFSFDGLSVDLFYNYEISNETYAVATHVKDAYKYSYYSHPKYQLCSAELYGIIVNVPCNPKHVIINTYGENWTLPIEDWDWYESPHNKGKDVYWDKERKSKSFQTFR